MTFLYDLGCGYFAGSPMPKVPSSLNIFTVGSRWDGYCSSGAFLWYRTSNHRSSLVPWWLIGCAQQVVPLSTNIVISRHRYTTSHTMVMPFATQHVLRTATQTNSNSYQAPSLSANCNMPLRRTRGEEHRCINHQLLEWASCPIAALDSSHAMPPVTI